MMLTLWGCFPVLVTVQVHAFQFFLSRSVR